MKKIYSIIISATVIIGLAGSVWAVSSYWHNYKAEETIHEKAQNENIQLAVNTSKLAIWQQRLNWLQQQIIELEKEYGCPNCPGTIYNIYKGYVQEYKRLQTKVQQLTK